MQFQYTGIHPQDILVSKDTEMNNESPKTRKIKKSLKYQPLLFIDTHQVRQYFQMFFWYLYCKYFSRIKKDVILLHLDHH